MMLTFEGTERLDSNLEERTIDIVERHKTNKGTKGLTGSGKRPIGDQTNLDSAGQLPAGVML